MRPTFTAPSAEMEVHGKTLRFIYDAQALAIFRRLTNREPLSSEAIAQFGLREAAAWLYAGLYRHQPGIDMEFCVAAATDPEWAQTMKILALALKSWNNRGKETLQ